jgi:hypothetical protein
MLPNLQMKCINLTCFPSFGVFVVALIMSILQCGIKDLSVEDVFEAPLLFISHCPSLYIYWFRFRTHSLGLGPVPPLNVYIPLLIIRNHLS